MVLETIQKNNFQVTRRRKPQPEYSPWMPHWRVTPKNKKVFVCLLASKDSFDVEITQKFFGFF